RPLGLVESPQSLFISRPDAAQAIVAYARYGQQNDVLVQRLDLKSGQVVGEHSFARNAKLLDASLDGTAFLMLPAESYATQEVLQLWRWKGADAEQVAEWKPYESQSSRRFAWATMLDATHVLTYHSSDEAAIAWDPTRRAEVYRVPSKSSRSMLISPGGKYLVQHAGLWLRFFTAADGKHAGSLGPLPDDYISLAALAFSRDGKSIAATFMASTGGSHEVVVFDATEGRQTHAVEVPLAADRLQWVGDGYLLSGAHLVSLAHEMTVWNYLGLQPYPQSSDDRAWFTVRAGSEVYLTAAPVPSSEVVSKIDAFVSANTPILQAGDSVGLQVTASGKSPRSNLQQELTELFRGKLTAAGYQVGDGQPFQLVVNVNEEDKDRQLQYRTFGSGASGPTTIQVPDRRVVCKVAFVDKANQEVWQQSTSIGP
ncbi:MAG: hypothetical protein JJ992_25345, partial [Planctomycetes bacterium]|nr:hypothetical protein [Planctomycetota bacterium]